MGRILMDEPLRPGEGILHHSEGVDLMPRRHSALRHGSVAGKRHEPGDHSAAVPGYCEGAVFPYSHRLSALPGYAYGQRSGRRQQDHSPPSRRSICPPRAWSSCCPPINKVKRQLNPKLQIDGILLTMVDKPYQLCQGDRRPCCAKPTAAKSRCFGNRDSPIRSGQRKSVPRARAFSPMIPMAR